MGSGGTSRPCRGTRRTTRRRTGCCSRPCRGVRPRSRRFSGPTCRVREFRRPCVARIAVVWPVVVGIGVLHGLETMCTETNRPGGPVLPVARVHCLWDIRRRFVRPPVEQAACRDEPGIREGRRRRRWRAAGRAEGEPASQSRHCGGLRADRGARRASAQRSCRRRDTPRTVRRYSESSVTLRYWSERQRTAERVPRRRR